MAKTKTIARCSHCGHVEPRWVGRCPQCRSWGSVAEEAAAAASAGTGSGNGRPAAVTPAQLARPIHEVPADDHQRTATGMAELDRVLGGGLVRGSVTLLGGEPGAGKSTLLLQAAHALSECRGRGEGDRSRSPRKVRSFAPGGDLARGDLTVLYVSAEESPGQVRLRAERLDALSGQLLLASETELPAVLGLIEAHRPDVLVVDSIQTVRHPDVPGAAGSVSQVRECAAMITRVAKERGMATLLVGHVTKEGQLAGPRVLEHLVDAVLDLSGDRHHALRLLRATKNRYGSVGEVGCFEMASKGLSGIEDAGRMFVGEAAAGTTGVAVTFALEGRRPLACEVQALVAPTALANPRRVASGLDAARLALLVAVLERRARVPLGDRDVYVSSVGGVRLAEPGVDLALCLAIASSRREAPVPRDLVVLGEVGLAGELRLVAQTERRLAEAARLGFGGALVPAAYDGGAHGLELQRARDLSDAVAAGLR